jgi:exonuclease SbcC
MEGVQRKLKSALEAQAKKEREASALRAKAGALAARLDELGAQRVWARREVEGLSALEQEAAEAEAKAAKAAEELEQLASKTAEARNERDSIRGEMAALKEAERQLEAEMRDIEASMAGISAMGPDSECPTCKRPLGKAHSELLEHFKSEMKDRQKRLSAARKGHKALEASLGDCDARLDALSKREVRLKSQASQADVLKTRLEHAQGRRKALAELEEKLASFEAQHAEAVAKLEGSDFDQEAYDRSREALDDLHRHLREEDRKLHERETGIARIEERCAAGRRDLERLRGLERKIGEKAAEASVLSELERVMADFRIHLISRIRPALASISGELLGVLTDGRYTELELSEDYDISVRDQGEMFDLERFSGGEKDLANLCLRLAISEVISTRHGTSGFDMIVLDEIFGSQDTNRKRQVLVTLNSLSNRFKQIFLITHVEDVKELMGNVIAEVMQ